MYNYTVRSNQLITKDTLLLTLSACGSKDIFNFMPGQYVALGYKRHGRPSLMRCFSIVSSPNDEKEIQVSMRIGGRFTQTVSDLKPGTNVFLSGPFGNFVIDEQLDRNIVMIAGGIGITPFISMLRYASESRLSSPIALLYSNTSSKDIPFYEEIKTLEKTNPKFKAAFFITNESAPAQKGFYGGRIDDQVIKQATGQRTNNFTYFICGPKGFIRSIKSSLASNGVDQNRLISEEFAPSGFRANKSSDSAVNLPKWTYTLSGATLVGLIAMIMVLDLARIVPKTSAQSPSTAQSSTTTNTSTQTTPTNTTSSDNSSSLATQPTQSTVTQPQTTYQSPVTSMS